MEKEREGQKELHCVFVNLRKVIFLSNTHCSQCAKRRGILHEKRWNGRDVRENNTRYV